MSVSLAKGQNGPLDVSDVVVSVQLAAAADLSALLVTSNGKVRSDADFVFFNQPTGPGVQLVPNPGGIASLRVSLAGVPADIEQVRAVITLDDASSNFGRTAAPTARVSDAAGNVLYEYVIDGLTTESIVIALEVYRRQGAWKVRAVGQGYAGGFAALVTDHGVSVDDAPAPPPPTPVAAPAPITPPSSVAPTPPAYNQPPQQQP
ncbi:TerD family protein, partial [Rhodococcus sp. (in: high G+C Gram-positive bacteria)]|uniref:TerD family protein n=2 Tax=Nocardiaceae TaxID=85025 RepID=UPI00257A8212